MSSTKLFYIFMFCCQSNLWDKYCPVPVPVILNMNTNNQRKETVSHQDITYRHDRFNDHKWLFITSWWCTWWHSPQTWCQTCDHSYCLCDGSQRDRAHWLSPTACPRSPLPHWATSSQLARDTCISLNTCHLTLFHMKYHSVVKTGVDMRNQISYMCLTRVWDMYQWNKSHTWTECVDVSLSKTASEGYYAPSQPAQADRTTGLVARGVHN